MREIVLDTETTGLSPDSGHRLVEIGCVELVNLVPTGNNFHVYINPERDMPEEAYRVHGLSAEFLSKHKVFSEVSKEFLDFVQDDPLVIHNAGFDMKFLRAELKWLGISALEKNKIVDTLLMARKKFPGAQASLDALCRRFSIDNSSREKHGALLDAELLSLVYLELMGGRQPGLTLGFEQKTKDSNAEKKVRDKVNRKARIYSINNDEQEEHKKFLEKIKDPLWKKYVQ